MSKRKILFLIFDFVFLVLLVLGDQLTKHIAVLKKPAR